VRFAVADTSMQPALEPGDRVVAVRWLRPCAGQIVVSRDPQQPARLLIKRVYGRSQDGQYVLLGDNQRMSRDSRAFGPVPANLIVGPVLWRYLPPDRRGRIV
jgi:nickel-type superoxide dismutase maturation protease